MKHFYRWLLYAAAPFILFACTKDSDEPDTAPTRDKTENSYAIPVDEALDNLDGLLSVIDGDQTRGADTRNRRIREIRTLHNPGANDATRSGETQPEEPLHIVNFDNDEGFAVLSADRRLAEDIYAVAESGNIDFDLLDRMIAERTGENTGQTRGVMVTDSAITPPPFYHGIVDIITIPPPDKDSLTINPNIHLDTLHIHDKSGTYVYSDDPYYIYGEWAETKRIRPLLRTQWDQGEPYNYFVIKNDKIGDNAGCGPIAYAQLITYFKHERELNYPDVWYNGGNNRYRINWSEIEKTFTTGPYNLSKSAPYKYNDTPLCWRAVSGLIYHLGEQLHATYKLSGTGVAQTDMDASISNLEFVAAYNRVAYNEDYALLMVRDRQLPVIMCGYNANKKGHYWLLEGLIQQTRKVTKVQQGIASTGTTCRYMFYCNWGWNSVGDGYYSSGFFDGPNSRVATEEGFDEQFGTTNSYKNSLELFMYKLK